MILREYLLGPRWLDSERVQALPDHLQLFFLRLGHACDGAGRFENNARILRPALYPLSLHKVSERLVSSNIVRLHEASLLKLYTVGDKGYGEVLNFGQRDTRRKVIYPADPGEPPQPELFTTSADPPRVWNGIESERNARGARGPQGKVSPERPAAERQRLFPRELETLQAELENELRALTHPGGCAWAVQLDDVGNAEAERLRRQIARVKQQRREAV